MLMRELAGGLILYFVVAGASWAKEPATRTFEFNYGAVLKDLPEGPSVRVWIPLPQNGDQQQVEVASKDLPANAKTTMEKKHGNKMFYFEPKGSGDANFHVTYKITRKELLGLKQPGKEKLTGKEKEKYLAADALVPLGGKPKELIANLSLSDDPIEAGKQLYLRTDEHMMYDKSRPGYGTGDANWACDSQFGNCTDFHSLFISFARP